MAATNANRCTVYYEAMKVLSWLRGNCMKASSLAHIYHTSQNNQLQASHILLQGEAFKSTFSSSYIVTQINSL